MRIAESLYMDGFICYPRVDNTVYPKSLPVARPRSSALANVPPFAAAAPIAAGKLEPTRGKKETTDHPPIYPTQAVNPERIDDDAQRKIYELVVRRFVATFADPSVSESTRADIEAGDQMYFVRGSIVVDPGYAAIYTYARSADTELPALDRSRGHRARNRLRRHRIRARRRHLGR